MKPRSASHLYVRPYDKRTVRPGHIKPRDAVSKTVDLHRFEAVEGKGGMGWVSLHSCSRIDRLGTQSDHSRDNACRFLRRD